MYIFKYTYFIIKLKNKAISIYGFKTKSGMIFPCVIISIIINFKNAISLQ